MGRKTAADSSIILPWERRGGLLRRLGLSRARPLLLTCAVVLLFVMIGLREHRAAGVRATRASLLVARQALDAYRASHQGKCPPDLLELEKKNYLSHLPTDAWGRKLILTCPGHFDSNSYEISSAGPDGEPGGLDRIE
jgi:general secretion pathway protein G